MRQRFNNSVKTRYYLTILLYSNVALSFYFQQKSSNTSPPVHSRPRAKVKYFSAPGCIEGQLKGIKTKSGDECEATYDVSKPVSAYVFKTIADPFVGRFSLVKVTDGVLKSDCSLYNSDKENHP